MLVSGQGAGLVTRSEGSETDAPNIVAVRRLYDIRIPAGNELLRQVLVLIEFGEDLLGHGFE